MSDSLEVFNAYVPWSIEARRVLRTVLDAESVSALVETVGFRLIHAADPAAYSRLGLGDLVSAELDEQIAALDGAASQLREELERWEWSGGITRSPRHFVGVLDTNVLMLCASRLLECDWKPLVDAEVGQRISLVIPQTVVRELDKLKRASGIMHVGGEKLERRTLARQALRVINEAFPGQETVRQIRGSHDENDGIVSALRLVLQMDDLRHMGLPDPDAEIIDRALGLVPWAAKVTLLTGDTSMRFRAEHAGLHALEPRLGEDQG